MDAWLTHTAHREILLNEKLREIGVGYVQGGSWGHYWVQDFGTRKDVYPLVIDGERFDVLSVRDPAELPWKELGVDVVFEATGLFRKKADAGKHLEAGARKVVITAPAPDPDVTLVLGCVTGYATAVVARLAGTVILVQPDAEAAGAIETLLDEIGMVDTDGDGFRELPNGDKLVLNLQFATQGIAGEVVRAANAGANVVHLHVWDEGGRPTLHLEAFQRTLRLIRARCDIVASRIVLPWHSRMSRGGIVPNMWLHSQSGVRTY